MLSLILRAYVTQTKDSAVQGNGTNGPKRKRKRQEDKNEFLPDRSAEELEEQTYGSLEFNEVFDEEVRTPLYSLAARWRRANLFDVFRNHRRSSLLSVAKCIPLTPLPPRLSPPVFCAFCSQNTHHLLN